MVRMDILIIEDNEEISTLLHDFLQAEGYSVCLANNGEIGVGYFEKENPKLVVLDIMLPGIDGFGVCKKIRETSNAPIIITSAKIKKEDKLNGLILGADDYMEKPYDIDILLAKIDGIFKRRYDEDKIICGDIQLDKVKRKGFKGKMELTLNVKEFELLQFFMENPGKTLSKELLFQKVWGFDSFSEPQTLTVHVKWLRQKIEDNPKVPKHIVTVWGIGYRFE